MSTPKPVDRVGAVDVRVQADYNAIHKRKYEEANATRPEYGYSQDMQNYDIHEGDPLFTYREKRRKSDTVMEVLSSVNGEGAEEREKYPNDPEMVRLAVKNKIRPVGVSTTDVSAKTLSYNNGLTMTTSGKNKLKAFSDFAPGQCAVLDVSESDARNLYRNISFAGTPRTKFTLVTKPADSSSAAKEAIKHVQESVSDPKKWETVMGTSRNTDMWKTFAQNMIQNSEVSGLLMLRTLLAEGKISLEAEELGADDEDVSIDESVARLAQYLGIVKSRPDLALLDRTQQNDYRRIKYMLDKSFFYDGKNPEVEFGFQRSADGTSSSSARDLRRGVVFSNKPEGQLLSLQLNQPAKTVASFSDAYNYERDWEVGMCTVGAKRGGHVVVSTRF